MKKILIALALIASMIVVPKTTNAMARNALDVDRMVTEASFKFGADAVMLWTILWCESRFDYNAIGDHGTSFGIAQIHLPAHPEITKEQAFDPLFSIYFLAKEVARGRAWQWTCWSIHFDSPELSTSTPLTP